MTIQANSNQIKVLCIDDNEADWVLIKCYLSDTHSGIDYVVDWEPDCSTGVEKISQETHDVFLVDHHLGKHNGIDIIQNAVSAGCNKPLILLTGHGSAEIDQQAMKVGATDYLNKNKVDTEILDRTIRYAIRHKTHEQKLHFLAKYDILTGLPNRMSLYDWLPKAIARARRSHTEIFVFFLDLDKFKLVNDTHGHDIGDQLLKEVSHRLQKNLRLGDTIFRLGGDEFTIVLEGKYDIEQVAKVAEKVLEIISESCTIGDITINTSTSIGISTTHKEEELTEDELLKRADMAMYVAKKNGSGCYRFFTEQFNEQVLYTQQLEKDLRHAINNDFENISIAYQPIIDIESNQVCGAEALLRWEHPTHGDIEPEVIIALADSAGLSHAITTWILQESCLKCVQWQNQGATLKKLMVSVNLSNEQIRNNLLINLVKNVLRDTKIDPKALEIEIKENAISENNEEITTQMTELYKLGVNLAIDDFGMGYTCLNQLKQAPVSVLKIDKTFTNSISNNEQNKEVVNCIIAIAKAFNLQALAEGVETKEHLDYLKKQGCKFAQGFYICHPLNPGEFEKFMLKQS